MSEYVEFFVKNGENYSPIGTFCRSNAIFEVARDNGVPYEGLRNVDAELIGRMRADLERKVRYARKNIRVKNDYLTFLQGAEMPAEDKVMEYNDTRNEIEELEDEITHLNYCSHFCMFLDDVIESAAAYDFDSNSYMWVGIEVPPSLIGIKDYEG